MAQFKTVLVDLERDDREVLVQAKWGHELSPTTEPNEASSSQQDTHIQSLVVSGDTILPDHHRSWFPGEEKVEFEPPISRPASPDSPHRPPPPRIHLQGMTWGYDVVRALDTNSPGLLMASLNRQGADPNAVVSDEGYGGHRWSVWSHRMQGDTVLHLAVRWNKKAALAGLYPVRHIFDLTIHDMAGLTASESCQQRFGLGLEELWNQQKELDIQAEVEKKLQALRDHRRQVQEGYEVILNGHKQAAKDFRFHVSRIGVEEEGERLLGNGRVVGGSTQEGVPELDSDARSQAKANMWSVSGMRPKHEGNITLKRPGEREEQFPVDVEDVENDALRVALTRLRDEDPKLDKIRTNSELKYGGQIGVTGAQLIGLCLGSTRFLTHLALPNQRLAAAGGVAIAEGLRYNRSVWYVDLRSNAMLDEGSNAMARMLGKNRTIKTLCLDANRITDASMENLAGVVAENLVLNHLTLKGNLYSEAGDACLRQALLRRGGTAILIQPKPKSLEGGAHGKARQAEARGSASRSVTSRRRPERIPRMASRNWRAI